MAIVFLLLRIDLTFKYWSSVYFAGHIVGVILFVVGKFILNLVEGKANLNPKQSSLDSATNLE